jgi:hypothetical protein
MKIKASLKKFTTGVFIDSTLAFGGASLDTQ